MSDVRIITVEEYIELAKTHPALIVLDSRKDEDYIKGHIPGAIQVEDIPSYVADTPEDAEVVVCCYRGKSAKSMVLALNAIGHDHVYALLGGFTAWDEHHTNLKEG